MNKKTLGIAGSSVAVAALACGVIVQQTHHSSASNQQQLAVARPTGTQAAPAVRMAAPAPKSVSLVVAGKQTAITTSASTVAAVLQQQHVALGKLDTVTPRPTTPVTSGMKVTVNRVRQIKQAVSTPIPHTSVTVRDDSLPQGTTKVTTPGSDGVTHTTWLVTWTNNVQTARTRVGSTTTPAVARRVHIGTKAPVTASQDSTSSDAAGTSSAGLNLANAAMWDRIAGCESSGNWSINTGNGYYGGLQFDLPTWASVGGLQFAPRPDLASRAQQITAANRLYAERGLSPWQCAWAA